MNKERHKKPHRPQLGGRCSPPLTHVILVDDLHLGHDIAHTALQLPQRPMQSHLLD